MVSCLLQLSSVLSHSLNMSTNFGFQGGPKVGIQKDSTDQGAFYAAGRAAQQAYAPNQSHQIDSSSLHPHNVGVQQSGYFQPQSGQAGINTGLPVPPREPIIQASSLAPPGEPPLGSSTVRPGNSQAHSTYPETRSV